MSPGKAVPRSLTVSMSGNPTIDATIVVTVPLDESGPGSLRARDLSVAGTNMGSAGKARLVDARPRTAPMMKVESCMLTV